MAHLGQQGEAWRRGLDHVPDQPREAASGSSRPRPNVVYLVLDDMGFASTGAFGNDVIRTPNIDLLAHEGLRYSNFHTTAICSATRTSLLTGINHHKAGVASLVDWTAPGAANGLGHVSASCGTTAEMLREHGYATFAVGKWHLSRQQTPAGPYDQWPLGRGFDRFYGFLAGMGDQLHPQLVQDNSYVPQPAEPARGYHLSEDLVDHAIDYVHTQHQAFPKQPFFLYLAFGATHTPFQAPPACLERVRGRFHEGWDALRRRWYENERRLGVIPAQAELTPRNENVPAWNDLTPNEKKLAERYMETFAAFLEHTDAQVGRLVDFLREQGVLDDTLLVLLSDNGASGEGGRNGQFVSLRHDNGTTSTQVDAAADAYGLAHLDEAGGEFSYVHYNAGWANALNAPFPWYKVLTFEGGTKDDLVVRWPRGISDPGAVRNQYLHVTDVTPTVLDVLGLQKPAFVRGVPQQPFTGVSFASTFTHADAPEVRAEQYYEVLGNRAIYKDGWKAVVNHLSHTPDFSQDRWELYHVATDYSEAHDVAAEFPEKLAELRAEFLVEAGKNGVFPLLGGIVPYGPEGDESYAAGTAENEGGTGSASGAGSVDGAESAAARPESLSPVARSEFDHVVRPLFVPKGLPSELSDRPDVDLDHASHEVEARVTLAEDTEGVIVCHGNRFGGFSLFVRGGRLHYVVNSNRVRYYEAVSDRPLPTGAATLGYRFVRDGLGAGPGTHPGIGATVTLLVDGEAAGQVHVERLPGHPLGAVELKANHFTEVSPSYHVPFELNAPIDHIALIQLEPPVRFVQVSLAEALEQD